jgi:ubiquinone/menaquinone biosynthesis C-methylase UbiE
MPEGEIFTCFTASGVAETYEDLYVPRIFIPWATALVDAAGLRPGEAVLDVATGPGTVARIAAERVGPAGRVVGTDLSAAMIAIAEGKPVIAGAARIEYLVSPAAPLKVASAAFDQVLCQQGLQFFPDRLAALREMARALKAGGRLAVAVWREIERQPSFAAIYRALRESLGDDAARPYAAPFAWPDGAALEQALVSAGFRRVRVEERSLPLTYEGGIAQAVRTLAASPVADAVAQLQDARRGELFEGMMRQLTPLFREGAIRTTMVSTLAFADAPS